MLHLPIQKIHRQFPTASTNSQYSPLPNIKACSSLKIFSKAGNIYWRLITMEDLSWLQLMIEFQFIKTLLSHSGDCPIKILGNSFLLKLGPRSWKDIQTLRILNLLNFYKASVTQTGNFSTSQGTVQDSWKYMKTNHKRENSFSRQRIPMKYMKLDWFPILLDICSWISSPIKKKTFIYPSEDLPSKSGQEIWVS